MRTLAELTRSGTAQRLKLDNIPTDPTILTNLKTLITVIDSVETILGGKIKIGSGYRSPAVNKAVGGSVRSYHMLGLAVDFDPPGQMTHNDAQQLLASHSKFIPYDLIMEEGTLKPESEGGSRWIHLQLAKPGQKPRYLVRDAIVDRLGGKIIRTSQG